MSKGTPDAKQEALRSQGTLNARAQEVTDPLFQQHEFFDPRDLLQVKYEMLHRVEVEGHSIKDTAAAFGFSRVAFYQAQKRFAEGGLGGLVRRQPGPKGAHKLTEPVVAFLREAVGEDPSLRPVDLVERVQERFGISLHARTIERALKGRQKKGSGA
jgi:transposase